MNNVIDFMKVVIATSKGIVQESIIYEHRENTEIIEQTNTTATIISMPNFKFKGEFQENAKRFIISANLNGEIILDILKLKPKQNDTILLNGESWRVLEPTCSDVDIDVICVQSSYLKTTKSVNFR